MIYNVFLNHVQTTYNHKCLSTIAIYDIDKKLKERYVSDWQGQREDKSKDT